MLFILEIYAVYIIDMIFIVMVYSWYYKVIWQLLLGYMPVIEMIYGSFCNDIRQLF